MKIDLSITQVLNSAPEKESFLLYKFLKSRLFLVVMLFVSLCSASFGFLIINWEQNKLEGEIIIRIPKGKTLRDVSNILLQKKIINSKRSFMVAVKTLGYEKDIQAGTLILHEAHTNYELINQLVFGVPELIKITILEGWNIERISESIHSVFGISKNKIIDLCQDRWFIQSLEISAHTLEGFLFPETYYFTESESPRNILKKMVSEYNKQITDNMKIRMKQIGFNQLEITTLASIIEGEAIFDSERKKISSVYHNRIRQGMKLQADPTIQYIIDDGPRRLLNKDLNIQSPYNTYLHKGLPPGPINSPGIQSINAALYPEDSEYIYFVARGDGYHTFSKTTEDHKKAKQKFNRVRKKINRKKQEENN